MTLRCLGPEHCYTVLDVLVDQWPAILGLICVDSLRWEIHGCILKLSLLASHTRRKSSGGGDCCTGWIMGSRRCYNKIENISTVPWFWETFSRSFLKVLLCRYTLYREKSIITYSLSQQECLQEAFFSHKTAFKVNHLTANPTAVCYLGRNLEERYFEDCWQHPLTSIVWTESQWYHRTRI